jgi:glycosyltransferase involved in cell wall biosynthesis
MNSKYKLAPFPFLCVRKIIRDFKPDIVNVCSPYPISLSALLLAKKNKIPVVGSIHILPENILAPLMKYKFFKIILNITWPYLTYFYNIVDWATVPTQTGAEIYKERGLTSKVTPISNGVDTKTFKPNRNGTYLRKKFNLPKENIVLYTGRINQEKNLDVLVNAIPDVLNKVKAHFLFCGSGGLKLEIIKLTEKLNVSKNTTFIDFLDWEDYQNIYSIADLFVMPAESELQSIVTLEAVASGLPAIVVDKGAVHELVSMQNGLVFESKNSSQLAKCIIKILKDKKLKEKMQKNSQKLIKNHSLKSVGDQYEKVYKSLLTEK